MTRRRLAAAVALAGVFLAPACDDAGTSASAPDAGSSGPVLVDPTTLERGEYLVRSLAGCGECHTPRAAHGDLDMGHWLAGVAGRFDLTPEDTTTGAISAPNLTPAHLADWSDQEITRAFRDGVGRDGAPLFPLMPYYAYHNMSDADAAAIVTYLRAIPSIEGDVPARQPLPVALDAPAPPVPESAIPHTALPSSDPRYAAAERGRYLAGEVGFCLDCHTPWRLGVTPPLDLSRVFAGGRAFSAADWSIPAPSPAVVYSYDVTPHASGLAGWTPDDVVHVLSRGAAPDGSSPCRPMPSGPTGGLGGLFDGDAYDIGVYLTTIPPVDGGDIPRCPAAQTD